MDFIYILFREQWDNCVIYLSKDEAIRASLEYPNVSVQMFTCLKSTSINVNKIINIKNNEYVPTYNYFLNGVFY